MLNEYKNEAFYSLMKLVHIAGKHAGYEAAMNDVAACVAGIKESASNNAPTFSAMDGYENERPVSLEDVDSYEDLIAMLQGGK